MKNHIKLPVQILFFCVLLQVLIACEEDVNPIPQTFFSFTYNGKQYNFGNYEIGPDGGAIGAEQQWLVRGGAIWINRPDIFGGVISYGDSNCTFLSPVHNDLLNLFDCHLTTDVAAVDSTAVYFYKSGSKSFTLDNCIIKTGYDFFFTGLKYTDTLCVQNGTFDLELINKQNKTILITNGKYRFNILNP